MCPWNSKGSERVVEEREPKQSVATTPLDQFQPMEIRLPWRYTRGTEGTTSGRQSTEDLETFSLFNPPLEALASFDEEDFRRIFARSPIKRAKYRGWLRNLCVAMGNSAESRFVSWLERAARHSDPVVREHAQWALKQLNAHSQRSRQE